MEHYSLDDVFFVFRSVRSTSVVGLHYAVVRLGSRVRTMRPYPGRVRVLQC